MTDWPACPACAGGGCDVCDGTGRDLALLNELDPDYPGTLAQGLE